jgi:Macrocin-O-methyltransferase (TylF)
MSTTTNATTSATTATTIGSGSSSEGTTADPTQIAFRKQMERLFAESPLSREDLLFNLGMYTRSSLLVKFLVMNDIYERVKDIPGAMMEFGVWWGQNLILLENLRAIHEPFNKQRIIVGFDTFSGYANFSDKDIKSDVMTDRTYATPGGYKDYLATLLAVHEGSNAFGHVRGNHRLVDGDAEVTVPRYFKDHPETIVAMAFFDIGVYRPTKAALEAIVPALVPGSVIVFDELTWPGAPGEAIAFKEVLGGMRFKIEKSRFYPSKAIVTIK